jgi:hypothetical protein
MTHNILYKMYSALTNFDDGGQRTGHKRKRNNRRSQVGMRVKFMSKEFYSLVLNAHVLCIFCI